MEWASLRGDLREMRERRVARGSSSSSSSSGVASSSGGAGLASSGWEAMEASRRATMSSVDLIVLASWSRSSASPRLRANFWTRRWESWLLRRRTMMASRSSSS